MLLNDKVPPNLLVSLGQGTKCIEGAAQEKTSVINCNTGRKILLCRIEILQEGEGVTAFKLVSISYYNEGKPSGLTSLKIRYIKETQD